jgi:hypothetical protein
LENFIDPASLGSFLGLVAGDNLRQTAAGIKACSSGGDQNFSADFTT